MGQYLIVKEHGETSRNSGMKAGSIDLSQSLVSMFNISNEGREYKPSNTSSKMLAHFLRLS